jgi:putative endonuclease
MGFPTEKQKIGRIGEDIAVKYLENKGFLVIGRNYLKKCGEIDIIAKKAGITHFIEVKSVTRENLGRNVSHARDKYRPEDNLHSYKLKRLARVIQLYLFEKHANGEPKWVFDAITVQIDTKTRRASVKFLENIVL